MALGAVMVVISISTFNWESIKRIRKVPKSDTFVMISTVITVLLTHNLAYGVIIGIILSSIFFAAKISEISIKKINEDKKTVYLVQGQLFFASTLKFINSFDFTEDVETVDIDLSKVRIWDESAVDSIDKVVIKFHKNGIKTNLMGMSTQCLELIDRMSVHNKAGKFDMVSNH
ncbi:STAS domain-containing protein [Clostridium sp. 5N-1]|uniref:STAS domain-containing protein n=2 Tax=Clostridium aquiflavi TaxID=3073603 RepID=A0ABU1EI16_9CLOT|nr:STAS domain-containing protein [Clostridium sp. 5N-1]